VKKIEKSHTLYGIV